MASQMSQAKVVDFQAIHTESPLPEDPVLAEEKLNTKELKLKREFIAGISGIVNAAFTPAAKTELVAVIIDQAERHPEKIEIHSSMLSNHRSLLELEVKALCQALESRTECTSVDLSYSGIEDASALHLITLLQKENSTILQLNLEGNTIGPSFFKLFQEKVMCQPSFKLKWLNLRGNPLNGSIKSLASEVFQLGQTLEYLNLDNTGCDMDSLVFLSNSLNGHKSLTSLNLSNPKLCSIQTDVPLHVWKMLHTTKIKTLSVERMAIGDQGLEALWNFVFGKTVLENELTNLDLCSNSITQPGGITLSKWIRHPQCKLQTLKLANNAISDEGALNIAESLTINTSITELDIRNNSIGQQGLIALAEAIGVNSTLRKILLWGNKFGTMAARKFGLVLARPRGNPVIIDLQVYAVDGVSMVARLDT